MAKELSVEGSHVEFGAERGFGLAAERCYLELAHAVAHHLTGPHRDAVDVGGGKPIQGGLINPEGDQSAFGEETAEVWDRMEP